MKTSNDNGLAHLYRTIIASALIWTVTVIGSASWNIYHEYDEGLHAPELEKKSTHAIILSHLAIWLLSSTILGVLAARGKKDVQELAITHEALMRNEEALREQERYTQSLLRLSRRLESAQNYDDAINAARDEVRDIIGYQNLWLYLFTEDRKHAKALTARGPMADAVMSEEVAATLTIEGDRMLEEIAGAKNIVVVEDAREDERTDKRIVANMGNRTIVNVPISLMDRHLGSIGTGTFGDEGVRTPTMAEQKYLTALASHLAVTLDRIHLFNERKRANETLRKNNDVVETIFSMTPTCIAYMDKDFNFIRVNKMYADADGKQPEDFTGKNHFELFPNAENEAIFRNAVVTGEQYIAKAKPFEYKFHPERGTSHWDWSLTPISNRCGEVEAVLLSLVNVSERIIAQEKLGNLNKELEQRVVERTAELQAMNAELERINRLFVGRELRMIELKERIRKLESHAEDMTG
jgi:PAS domain S-box-containing protein